MERPDEKQPAASTSPDTRAPARSSVVAGDQSTANLSGQRLDPSTGGDRSTPLHSLRNEIRVWTRDLLIAIGLALVIIVFLYQPVKVEGTSMAPLLSDQERIFINKFVPFRTHSAGRCGGLLVSARSLKIVHQARGRLTGRIRGDSPGRGLRRRQNCA